MSDRLVIPPIIGLSPIVALIVLRCLWGVGARLREGWQLTG